MKRQVFALITGVMFILAALTSCGDRNGSFASGFDYHRVIGGNNIAFVMQDGRYGILDVGGTLQ
jgi:hypothetical protein